LDDQERPGDEEEQGIRTVDETEGRRCDRRMTTMSITVPQKKTKRGS
jgi:hypothetical protein